MIVYIVPVKHRVGMKRIAYAFRMAARLSQVVWRHKKKTGF